MSLVAYGSSDESGSSDVEDTSTVTATSAKRTNTVEAASEIGSGRNKVGTQLDTDSSQSAEKAIEPTNDISDSDEEISPSDRNEQNIEDKLRALPTPRGYSTSVLDESDVLEDVVKPRAAELADAPKPPSRKRQPVKITIPALPDSDDEDDSKQMGKKPKFSSSMKKSGLTALLPPPVHAVKKETNRILLPYSLGKKSKPAVSAAKPTGVSNQNSDSNKISKLTSLANYDSDSDDDTSDDKVVNFFALDSTPEISTTSRTLNDSVASSPATSNCKTTASVPTVPVQAASGRTALHLPAPMKQTDNDLTASVSVDQDSSRSDAAVGVHVSSSVPDQDAPLTFKGGRSSQVSTYASLQPSYPVAAGDMVAQQYTMPSYEPYPEVSDDQAFQHDEHFLRMQGKKQRGKEEINIVDVNADDYMNPADLGKYLSEESEYQSHRKKDNQPTSQQKRKHQIQYLAFQAKERELELKNQWADNRQTKKQTQAKYGF